MYKFYVKAGKIQRDHSIKEIVGIVTVKTIEHARNTLKKYGWTIMEFASVTSSMDDIKRITTYRELIIFQGMEV